MTALARVQRLFTSVLDGAADSEQAAAFHSLIDTASLAPERRVGIYRDSSRLAREKALEAIYPVCLQVLGQRCFAGLAGDYVTDYPSRECDLNVYGEQFPEYLQTQVRVREALAELPYLADLARLEWRWHAVYYAPNDKTFDMERFSSLIEEGRAGQAQFQLSAAMRLLATAFPVCEIWKRHREGRDTSVVRMSDGDHLVIRRVGFRPRVETVEPEIFTLLHAVSRGATLETLAADGLPVERLPQLIGAGWVVSFTITADSPRAAP